MLYMVELDFADPARLEQWEAWYGAHLLKLLNIPGFLSAQRFRSLSPCSSPFLAVYQVESQAVFSSEPYRTRAGPSSPGEWIPFMINWRRNLFDGQVAPPQPVEGQYLAVVDRVLATDPALPPGMIRLPALALDRSVIERGIAVGDLAQAKLLVSGRTPDSGRIFRALTPLMQA